MKVDIVYYEIPADFEMEFNLNGCCPMRLLKTLTYNKKEYIEGLARAVSRSKIVIVCGPIYGEDGLIKITSKATHRPTEIINNAEYGIAQDLNVEIIEGSVPLVTTSGLFGGIIIESGPQTIIILSENRDIRKNVMQNLIHAYVRDVSILEIKRNSGMSALSGSVAENSAEDNEDILTEEDFENLPEAGEAVDFSEEEQNEEDPDLSAPSDEALESIAKEINDLSSEIGKTLYAGGEAAAAESDTAYEIELSEDAIENTAIPAKGDTAAPQIDFTIDTDETESEPEFSEPTVSLDNFIFDEKEDNTGFDISEEQVDSEMSARFEEEEELDRAYILSPDEDSLETKHKGLVRAIVIIIGLLAAILLVLAYFLIYVPYTNGIAPLDYIKNFLNVKTILTFWRG